MRYVTFDVLTGDIRSASGGPPESHLNNLELGYAVGDAREFTFDGARENYVFCPDRENFSHTEIIPGKVLRKAPENWNLEAEERDRKWRLQTNRLHALDPNELDHLDIYFMIPSRFDRLPNQEQSLQFQNDGLDLNVTLTRKVEGHIPFHFEFGGYSFPLERSIIRFTVQKNAPFIQNAIADFLANHPPNFNVFIPQRLQSECLKFAIKVANHIIDAYRIAYDDPATRPVGIADDISCAVRPYLCDGVSTVWNIGNPFRNDTLSLKLHPPPVPNESAAKIQAALQDSAFQTLLNQKATPFLQTAVATLKTAHLYGQYRECVVWAGAIISNIIEELLLEKLPKDSPEYKKLKTRANKVTGNERRNAYFRMATGTTLAEALTKLVSDYGTAHQDIFWKKLPQNVEEVLNSRNLLLHRKKAIDAAEADRSFYTCMNFVYGISAKVPYSSLYSRDYSLRLLNSTL